MRKVFLFFCFFALFLNGARAQIVIESLEDPEYLNQTGAMYSVSSAKKPAKKKKQSLDLGIVVLSRLEEKVFGTIFTNDNSLNRLQRLEAKVFGAIQTGDFTPRLQKLVTATKGNSNLKSPYYAPQGHYNPYYSNNTQNPYDPYTPYKPYKKTGLKEFLKIISGGTLTGFSPPITPQAQNYWGQPIGGQTLATPTNSLNRMNIFSNGASGSETYSDDGQFKRNLNSSDGGLGVKIIY